MRAVVFTHVQKLGCSLLPVRCALVGRGGGAGGAEGVRQLWGTGAGDGDGGCRSLALDTGSRSRCWLAAAAADSGSMRGLECGREGGGHRGGRR